MEEEINKIYYELLRNREETREKVINPKTGHLEYMAPTEHERTRFMIKAAAIFLKSK